MNVMPSALRTAFATVLLASLSPLSSAEVQLSTRWDPHHEPDGSLVPDSRHEIYRLKAAAAQAAAARNTVPPGVGSQPESALPYKLSLDDTQYYLQPMLFMARRHEGEVCTPAPYDKAPTYRCVEGQRYTRGCHVLVFDRAFKEVGFHTVRINEPQPYFCNAVVSAGVASRMRNELLLTVQYFPLDGQAASEASEIGSTWRRMTIRLRLRAAQGKEQGRVAIEQDDGCLGNPNRIETVPDARERLRRCAAASAAR